MDSIFRISSIDRCQVHWEDHLLDLTAVENIGGMWWKREDKFAPLGPSSINGSKLRQLIWLFSQRQFAGVASGAVTHSPQLPMVAACAKHWGIPCVQFTGGQGEMVTAGEDFGAETRLVNPGYTATLNAKARQEAASKGWLHIETDITLEHKINPAERIEALHRVGSEQVKNIPDHIENLLIPAGSCNSLTSILYGLGRFLPKSLKTVHLFRIMGNVPKHKRWTDERLGIIRKVTGEELPLPYEFVEHDLVDSGYTTYKEMKPYSYGIPSSPFEIPSRIHKRRNIKNLGLSVVMVALLAVGILAGCSQTATKSPDVSDSIRKSLDQAGLKNVSVSQDRDKGIVTLGGQVASENDKSQAESIAKSLAGAQVVADQIAVIPVGLEKEATAVNSDLDQGIEKNLDAALIQNKLHKSVKYEVKNGVVTLTGEVNSEAKRTLAEKVATGVPNVTQVVNDLQVKNQKASSSQ